MSHCFEKGTRTTSLRGCVSFGSAHVSSGERIYTSKYKNQNPLTGFTLVETLVAVSILLLVIVGPMNIAADGMQMGYHANQEMTAVFLAQEAIEAIEKLRDDNALVLLNDPGDPIDDSWDWYDALPASCKNVGESCDVNLSDYSFHACGDCLLKYDSTPDERVYGYGLGFTSDSIYTRNISLSQGTGYSRQVTVTVSWNSSVLGLGNQSVTLQTWIYDTYEHYE